MSGTPTVADVGDTHRGWTMLGTPTVAGRGTMSGTPTVAMAMRGGRCRGHPPWTMLGGRCRGHPPWPMSGTPTVGRCRGHPPWLDDVVLGCWGHPPWTRGDVGDVGDTHRGRCWGHPPWRWRCWGHPPSGRGRGARAGTPTVDDVGDTHRGDGDVGDTHRVEARIANDCLAELSVTGNTVTLAGLIAGTTTVRGRQRRRPCRIGGGGLRSAGQPSRGADWASYFSGAAPAIDGSAGAGLDGQHIYLWRDEDIALVVLTQYSHFANGLRLEFRQLAECMRRTQLPVRTRPVANCRVAASSSCSSGWLNCVDRRRGWDAARPGEA